MSYNCIRKSITRPRRVEDAHFRMRNVNKSRGAMLFYSTFAIVSPVWATVSMQTAILLDFSHASQTCITKPGNARYATLLNRLKRNIRPLLLRPASSLILLAFQPSGDAQKTSIIIQAPIGLLKSSGEEKDLHRMVPTGRNI